MNENSKPLLPLKEGSLSIHRDQDILTITSRTNFTLRCNMQYNLCWFTVNGWYFGRVAGILGTINNEAYDDYTMAQGQISENPSSFVPSWLLREYDAPPFLASNSIQKTPISDELCSKDPDYQQKTVEVCQLYFKSDLLSACANHLDPEQFYQMCLDLACRSNRRGDSVSYPANRGACSVALAYIEACATLHIPMRIPEQCIQ